MEQEEFAKLMREKLVHLINVEAVSESSLSKISIGRAIRSYIYWWWDVGIEDEMMKFVNEHPNASYEELRDYALSIAPPLEMVDDDELDNGD